MKRLLSLVILSGVLLSCIGGIANASTDQTLEKSSINNEFTVENCYKIAQQALTEYYTIVYGGLEDYRLSINLEADIQRYVTNKMQFKSAVTQKINAKGILTSTEFELQDSEQTADAIKLTMKSFVTYKWPLPNPEIDSGRGEGWIFVFQKNGEGISIAQWHSRYDDYDFENGYDLENSKILQSKSGVNVIDDSIFEKQSQQFNLEKINKPATPSTEPPEIEGDVPLHHSKALNTLNKTAIKNWARANFNVSQPSSGGSSVPYYDFSQMTGAFDCTNFVSHALLAGGAKPYDTGGTGISSTGWYYRSTANRSSSWTGVPNLYNFIVGNTGKGPTGTGMVYDFYDIGLRYYEIGDIIQHQNDIAVWRHSTVVTGYYYPGAPHGEYVVGAFVTGRSKQSVGMVNDNEPAESIYPGLPKRIISLKGYNS